MAYGYFLFPLDLSSEEELLTCRYFISCTEIVFLHLLVLGKGQASNSAVSYQQLQTYRAVVCIKCTNSINF